MNFAPASFDFVELSQLRDQIRTRKFEDLAYLDIDEVANAAGSTEIDSTRPGFAFSSTGSGLPAGTIVNKMGRTTGWTSGPVIQTCVDVTFNENGTQYTFLCQDKAEVHASWGDSGGPVFTMDWQDRVTFLGIAWRMYRDEGLVFSPVDGIHSDFGPSITFN